MLTFYAASCMVLGMGKRLNGLRCEACCKPLSATMGRRARFCSPACRQAAYRARKKSLRSSSEQCVDLGSHPLASVPLEMRRAKRWVRCVLTRDGRKLPVGPDGRALRWSDSGNWLSFEEASEASWGDGFGFVLGDGFGCVDLDDCFVGGELSLLARTVVSRNRGAFVEVSRSGCGLHVFGRLAEGAAVVERGFEVYSRGRFMWVTGDVFGVSGWSDLRV